MTNFDKDGKTIPFTPSGSDVVGGDVILVGEKICVAKHDIADGVLGTLSTQGVFDFPKTAATVYGQGDKVFWDVADDEATEDDDTGTNRLIGYIHEAALSGDALVRCMLVDNVL